MTERESEIIGLLHKEVKPALGCTEPIAVALAAAKATEILGSASSADVEVSGNILKNGMGVGIPGTDMIGLNIAAALGVVCGRSRYGLEVLKDLTEDDVKAAKQMVAEGKVRISIADNPKLLYVKVTVEKGSDSAWAVIEDDHDRIVETGLNGKVISSGETCSDNPADERDTLDYHLTVKEIYAFSKSVSFDDIKFILGDRDLNLALAHAGLEGNFGLGVGKAIRENQHEIFGDDVMRYRKIRFLLEYPLHISRLTRGFSFCRP